MCISRVGRCACMSIRLRPSRRARRVDFREVCCTRTSGNFCFRDTVLGVFSCNPSVAVFSAAFLFFFVSLAFLVVVFVVASVVFVVASLPFLFFLVFDILVVDVVVVDVVDCFLLSFILLLVVVHIL